LGTEWDEVMRARGQGDEYAEKEALSRAVATHEKLTTVMPPASEALPPAPV
jgi:hypothetical protein